MKDMIVFLIAALPFALLLLFVFRKTIRNGSWLAFALRVVVSWALFAALAGGSIFFLQFDVEPSIDECLTARGVDCEDARLAYVIPILIAMCAAFEFLLFALTFRVIANRRSNVR